MSARMEKGNTPQGRILLSEDEVQALIEKFSGTGTPKVNKRGVFSERNKGY